MSTLHATAAKKASAKAAPPVMRKSAPPPRHAAPPLASLAAIPATVQRQCENCEMEEPKESAIQRRLTASAAAPLPQRACAACEAKGQDESSVQPRLEVGPVGDRYEQEADSIAVKVMAMPAPNAAATAAEGSVQRACSACSSSRDEPRARRLADAEAETDRVVRARRDGGGETIAASDTELTSGGSAMPAATRSFFESRMGRDLGDVRIHSGGDAAARNDSISARAFTYKNHVWLGAGESASPTFTMAHELAHVMQQTSPGPVGPQRREEAEASDAAATVQRMQCNPARPLFYFPKGVVDLNPYHDDTQEWATGKDTGMLGEARVPNANEHGFTANPSSFGFADLVKTSNGNLVGMGFQNWTPPTAATSGPSVPLPPAGPSSPASGGGPAAGPARPWHTFQSRKAAGILTPANTTTFKTFFRGGKRFDAKTTDMQMSTKAAPRWNGRDDFTRDAASAPTSIQIGEVKFGGGRSLAASAKTQVDNYVAGYEDAAKGYEQLRIQNARAHEGTGGLTGKSSTKDLASWTFSAGLIDSWAGPAGWQPVGAKDQKLVVGQWLTKTTCAPCDDSPEFQGRLHAIHDPDNKHLWLYQFFTTDASGRMTMTAREALMKHGKPARDLKQAMLASPAKPGTKRRPRAGAATRAAPSVPPIVRRDPRTKVRRKPKPQKPVPEVDPFATNYTAWRERQAKLTTDFEAFGKTKEGKTSIGALLADTAMANSMAVTGSLPAGVKGKPTPTAKHLEDVKLYGEIELMSGKTGRLLGAMRKTFGSAFVKVINIYKKLRERFAAFWENRKKNKFSKKGRLAAAVMKIGGMIFAAIVHQVLPQIGHLLIACLESGFTAQMEKLFGDAFREQIGDKIDEVEAKLVALETEIETQIETAVGNVFSGVTSEYERIMAVWDDVGQLIGIAKTAFNVARVAACAATGIETVGIGCIVAGVDFVLSLFDVSPSELLAESLLGTCMAQELIGDYVLTIKEVKDFPTTAAQAIVDFVGPLLPSVSIGTAQIKLSDLLCKSVGGKAEMPDTSEVTCGKGGSLDGQPGGKNYRLPAGVDPNVFNRVPTDEELKHGRLPKPGTVPKAPPAGQSPTPPTQPPPAQPPGGTTPEEPPTHTPPTHAPSGGKGGTDSDADAGPPTEHGVVPGKIEGGTFVTVNYYVHGIGGGFSAKDYKGKVMTVFVDAVDSNAVYYGPDQVDIKVYEVFEDPKRKGVHKIKFEPVKDYILWFRSAEGTQQLGFVVKRREGQVGAPM